MAQLFPFRALRPAPAVASEVASVPYDVVNTEEARALAAGHPLSFLHVTRSEIDLPAGTNPYDASVYAQAVHNFESLVRSAPLVPDPEPALYFYRLKMGAPHSKPPDRCKRYCTCGGGFNCDVNPPRPPAR